MSIIKKFIFSIFIFLCLSGCGQGPFSSSGSQYLVRKVIDGDTVELNNGMRARYLGVDTPEIRYRKDNKWVYAPDLYAEEAKEFNRKLVEGRVVRLEFDVTRQDKYKRSLVYCFAGDIFINAKLLEEGYALLYASSPNVKYMELFISAQNKARRESRGLWATVPVISVKEAKHYVNRIVIVEGRVTSARQSSKVAILNFGTSNFKGVIFKNQFPLFMIDGVNISSYKGKIVRIIGKVKEYKGDFEIIIFGPGGIEIF